MPFFPIVNPSDKVRHSARRENALTELLNRNGMMTPGKSFRFGVRTLRIPVYNSGAATLPAGAVAFGPNSGFQEDAIPVIALSDPDALYGILTEPLEPNAYGDAIVAGVAAVRLSAALPAGTKFVEPGDGGSFKAASGGRAQVIASQGNTALVLLGGAGAGAAETVLCRVDGGNAESGFNVTLYGNGKDQPKTGTGILFVPELALGSTIPAGSWILGHRSVMQITGGGEE